MLNNKFVGWRHLAGTVSYSRGDKNTQYNYSPRVVPILQIWGLGPWTKYTIKQISTCKEVQQFIKLKLHNMNILHLGYSAMIQLNLVY